MPFTFDLTFLSEFLTFPPWQIIWGVFKSGGWMILVPFFIVLFLSEYIRYKQNKTESQINYVLLAIDVPKDIETSTKAVEQIFAQLTGAYTKLSFLDKLKGKIQESFSLEILSQGGYTQFLVRTPNYFRDLIEAAIYAQYPEAEIVEVEDYTRKVELSFPSDKYDLWGTEFILAREESYPIRTYPYFEHAIAEQKFADPMAALLETLTKITDEEQIWLQWIITPRDDKWKAKGEWLVKKLIGAKAGAPKTILDLVFSPFRKLAEESKDILVYGLGFAPEGAKVLKEAPPSLMQFLSPGEQDIVKAIQEKISKIGFQTKFRMIYFGPREIFEKGRGVAAVVGAIAQFNTLNLNSFKAAKKTKTKEGLFLKQRKLTKRQRKILTAFKTRSTKLGVGKGIVLNIEEIASLWHFPTITVKAPLVKKIGAKREGPPMALPVYRKMPATSVSAVERPEEGARAIEEGEKPGEKKLVPPENLPIG